MSNETPERWGRREEVGLLALIVLVVGVVLAARTLDGSRLSSLDHPIGDPVLAAGAGAPVDTSDIAIVLVDDDSLARLGERWPLKRRVWADFLDVMHTYGPAVIALDAWFESPEPTVEADLALDLSDKLRLTGLTDAPVGALLADQLDALAAELDGDRQLARAIGAGGPVILGTACVPTPTPAEVPGLFVTDAPPEPRLSCPGLSGNLAPLALSARGQAGLDVLRDPDGLVRRYPYVVQAGDIRQLSLAAAAVRVGRPDAAPAALDRVAALDGATPFLRPIEPEQFTTVRFADVLFSGPGNAGLEQALRGRLVFVGVSAQGTEDLVFTPLGVALPGITVHANAAVDLLQDRHVHSDGAPARAGLGLGLALLIGVTLVGHRFNGAPAIGGTALGASAAWVGTGAVAMGAGWVLPQVPVLTGIGAWAVARMAFSWRRTDLAKRLAQAQREQLLEDLKVRNAELQETLDTLRRTRSAKERMEAELRVGRDIQLAMVPNRMPDFAGRERVAVSTALEPAREVGGDFYDYFALPSGRLCFAVGDVSGKGVGAALFMARTQTLLRVRAAQDASPGEIVSHANDELARDNETAMFVTLFLAILDLETGALTWTNAGHNPPYVLRADGTRVRLDARHGPVVGAMEDLAFGQDTLALGPGDQVLAFTDGVTEAMDAGSALYGEPRLVAALDASRPADDAATVRITLEDVRRFQGAAEQADDITILALKFHGGA